MRAYNDSDLVTDNFVDNESCFGSDNISENALVDRSAQITQIKASLCFNNTDNSWIILYIYSARCSLDFVQNSSLYITHILTKDYCLCEKLFVLQSV